MDQTKPIVDNEISIVTREILFVVGAHTLGPIFSAGAVWLCQPLQKWILRNGGFFFAAWVGTIIFVLGGLFKIIPFNFRNGSIQAFLCCMTAASSMAVNTRKDSVPNKFDRFMTSKAPKYMPNRFYKFLRMNDDEKSEMVTVS